MMTLPFENDTCAVVKKLAKQRIKAYKGRNLFIIYAIILTTVLFATFFSIGGGFLDQARQNEQRQSGTSHATVKFLSQGQYDALADVSEKKDISYTRLVGTVINSELSKLITEVRYAEDNSAKGFLCYPKTGEMPQKENEIATSTLVLDALGVPHKVGETLHLSISVDGEYHEKDFVLSGFWEGYTLAAAQEAWVSYSYANQIAPPASQIFEETGKYAGLYCADINFTHPWQFEKQLNDLLESAKISDAPNSINPSYGFVLSQDKIDVSFLLAIAVLLGTILLAGYLIIYNLFYISVTQDIHFFGMLRTIGASSKQLRAIVRKQAFLLAIIGLPFGLLIGFIIGRMLLPFVLTQINVTDTGIYRVNPLILIGAALFSLLTVYIGSLKPCNYAAKVPAIEAIRYSGESGGMRRATKKTRKTTPLSMAIENLKRNRKKAILVILSLAFSLILLNTTYTAVRGFDLNTYLKKYAVADFYVTDFSIKNYGYDGKNLSGVSKEFLAEMESLPGLENSASVYVREIQQTIPDNMVERFKEIQTDSSTEIDTQFISMKNTSAQVYGIDNALVNQVTLMTGEWNMEQWDMGNYVIVTDFFYQNNTANSMSPFYQIGDSVTLLDQNGNEKIYIVMGIGNLNYNLDAQYDSDFGLRFIIPEESYRSLYGNTQPLCTIFNINDAKVENAENWISDYCANVETSLTYISHRVYEQEYERDKSTYVVIGGVLAMILAMIGLLNFINAIATSIIVRQKELAMLGAIGMSRKQIKKMLIFESLAYIGLVVAFTATLGTGICYFVCSNLISNMWAFAYRFTLTPVLLCLPFLVAVAVFIPLWYNQIINKKSIVERLRIG